MDRIACLGWILWCTTALVGAQVPHEFPTDPLAAVVEMRAQAAVAGGLSVVVIAADGTPAIGAVVVALSSRAPDHDALQIAAERRFPGDEPRILAARALGGIRHRLDPRACTRVAEQLEGCVIALHGDHVAIAYCGADPLPRTKPSELTLRLLPPIHFDVAVVHAKGAPASGVRVGVIAAPGHRPSPSAWTDADGHVGFVLVPGRTPEARVCIAAATVQPCASSVPESGGAVTFQLPACGRVLARLVDETVPGADLEWFLPYGDQAFSLHPDLVQGAAGRSAVFELVEQGFVGRVVCMAGVHLEMAGIVDGVVAGAEREIEVRRGADIRTMALRVVDPSGRPMAAVHVRADWQLEGRHGSGATTTAAGWVELTVPDDRVRSGALHLEVWGATASQPLIGWADLDVSDTPGRILVGDVRLLAPAVAVRGKFVDSLGAPVADLKMRTRVGDKLRQARSAADGTFSIELPTPLPDSLSIEVAGDAWFLTEAVENVVQVTTGGDDVTLVVRRAARIRFAARDLPAHVPTLLSLVAVPSDRAGPSVKIRGGLSANELRVPTGTWDLMVRQGSREVYRIAEVHADAGIEAHDARLMDFAWQEFATLVQLQVLGADGKPSDACAVRYSSDGSSHSSRPQGGTWQILVPKVGGRIVVTPDATDSAPIAVEVVAGEQVVRLGPAR